jgi:CheY-like chemotaxis protein
MPAHSNNRESESAPDLVLVVEDDSAIRDTLCDVIRAQGYRVEGAADGLAALETLRWGARPCVILLDLQMRVMTGWEFRREQQADPAIARIPVVAMTAGRWKQSDLGDYAARLDKPINLETLKALLGRYCDPPVSLDTAGDA